MDKAFYITTAIDYANGSPHIGHAYEKVLADAFARVQRLRGRPVHFLTGLDEHGTKVLQSAQARGVAPQALCDEVAAEFQALLRTLNIAHDDYVRTTQERHKQVVRAVLRQLKEQGDIYLGEYRGFYSTRQEQFVLEKEKVDGQWPEIYGEVTEIVEPNFFFRLEPHRAWLRAWLEGGGRDWIFPAFRQTQVVEFLKQPLNDLCISRPAERLPWGISLPFDEKYVTYVWFDALVNYISAVGYGTPEFARRWPADAHVIGKDILVPPHAVYWPIMLHRLGVELPRRLVVHGFWLSGGAKESKTDIEKAKAEGRARFNPLDVIATHGADAFRYFVLREMVLGQDAEFTAEQFTARYNSELANDFGNLVSRLLNMVSRYCGGKLPERPNLLWTTEGDALAVEWSSLAGEIEAVADSLSGAVERLEFFGISQLLNRINGFVKSLNGYVESRAPWKLAKPAQGASAEQIENQRLLLEASLVVLAEGVRLAATAYAPVMPTISAETLKLLGQAPVERWEGNLDWDLARLAGAKLGDKAILFPKVETAAPAGGPGAKPAKT